MCSHGSCGFGEGAGKWHDTGGAGQAAGILRLGLELLGYFRAVLWLCGGDSSCWVGTTSHPCPAATLDWDRGPQAGVKLCSTHASSQGRARPGAIWQRRGP